MAKEKEKELCVFVACEKHPMFLVLLFFVAGFLSHRSETMATQNRIFGDK